MSKQDWTKPMSPFAMKIAKELVDSGFIIVSSANTEEQDAEAFARKVEDLVQETFTITPKEAQQDYCRDCGTIGTRIGPARCGGRDWRVDKPCTCKCHKQEVDEYGYGFLFDGKLHKRPTIEETEKLAAEMRLKQMKEEVPRDRRFPIFIYPYFGMKRGGGARVVIDEDCNGTAAY